jgi:hypothetical protein
MYLVTPKAGAKRELLFNELATGSVPSVWGQSLTPEPWLFFLFFNSAHFIPPSASSGGWT